MTKSSGKWAACAAIWALAASGQAQLVGVGSETGAAVHPGPDRPNILLVVLDDVGFENVSGCGVNPDAARTPVIDQLAAEGVLFRNAWANPGCSPTRATIMTGQYAFRTGVGRAIGWTSDFELSPAGPMLPRMLRLAGYRTRAVGKWHLSVEDQGGYTHPLESGFEHHAGAIENLPSFYGLAYFDYEKAVDGVVARSNVYATTESVDDALGFIGAMHQPWFLYLSLNAPHGPFHKPPAELHTYDLEGLGVQDNIPIHMKAMTEAADTELGRLLAGIPQEELDRTTVIVVGDNGTDPLATVAPWEPSHAKGSLYQGGIHVPLVAWGASVGTGESNALVNVSDLYATVLQLAGYPGVATPDSVSLVPALLDPGLPSARAWAYSEKFGPNGLGPWVVWGRVVRNDRFKLHHYVSTITGDDHYELYNLELDPFETNDLLLGELTGPQAAALAELQALLVEISG